MHRTWEGDKEQRCQQIESAQSDHSSSVRVLVRQRSNQVGPNDAACAALALQLWCPGHDIA